MTMIYDYDSIPFVELVQNFSVGNYEPYYSCFRENMYD